MSVHNQLRTETAFTFRFVAFGVLMAFANIVPYPLTCGGYGDTPEIAGWPLKYWECGGFAGYWHFSAWAMTSSA